MNIQIKYNPSYALALVSLDAGEKIKAEGGSLVSKSANISIQTHKANKGGLFKTLKSKFLGGESFWMNTFTAEGRIGEVTLAPALPGDLKKIDLNGTILVQSTSYMASIPHLEIDTKFQGLKGFLSRESLFFLKISGNGPVIISSFGAIHEVDIENEYIVNTGHIVAFESTLEYKIEKIGGLKSLFFSGEGLVCRFSGKGKLYIQTRNPNSFAAWTSQFNRIKNIST